MFISKKASLKANTKSNSSLRGEEEEEERKNTKSLEQIIRIHKKIVIEIEIKEEIMCENVE